MGIDGPAGSGKTKGALALAVAMFGPKAKIALIDSEHESASLYADKFNFDTLPLEPPYTSAKYEAGIQAAVDGGYDVCIVDSISHQWAGEGGILSRKDQMEIDNPRLNSYTLWGRFTKEHEKFKARILNAPIHIIATMRSKMDYQLVNKDGKQVPEKLGMAPIQREGMEYEFSLVFSLGMNHVAQATKDRTDLFAPENRMVSLLDPAVGKELYEWLMSGKAVLPPTEEQLLRIEELATETGDWELVKPRLAGITTETAADFIARLTAKYQRMRDSGELEKKERPTSGDTAPAATASPASAEPPKTLPTTSAESPTSTTASTPEPDLPERPEPEPCEHGVPHGEICAKCDEEFAE